MVTTESRLTTETPPVFGENAKNVATPAWFAKYRYAIFVTDLVVIVAALLVAQRSRFGTVDGHIMAGPVQVDYAVAGLVIELIWVLALTASESRSMRVIGAGLDEYRKVINATFATFGLIAVCSYLLSIEFSRFYFVVALPLGLGLLLSGRLAWRLVLTSRRRQGRAMSGTLIVGDWDEVERTIRDLRRHPEAGYKPVAISVVGPDKAGHGDPLMESLPRVPRTQVAAVAANPRMRAVMIAGSVSRRSVRELAWQLESAAVDLIMVSRLTDVAGPRMHVVPVDGLPMVHVDLPQYTGLSYAAKRTMDIMISGVALFLLSPVFVAIAAAIKLDDGGPVLFRQERVGQNSTTFTMHKFRSMVLDAEAKVAELMAANEGNGVLFKMKRDPRVTRVGAFLRKHSLDELPQFWDVLVGNMSVVGPRPPLMSEVETYEEHVHRRLLTKPGITGLWQVSGRSDLSWDESVRLDLRYVENWSISSDIVIILKTIRAVLRPRGAY